MLTGAVSTLEIEKRVEGAIANIKATDLVRVNIVGRHKMGVSPDVHSLEFRYRDRFYYFDAYDRSSLEIDFEAYKSDKSLKGELVRLVFANESLSDKEKADIIEYGFSALMGEIPHGKGY